MFTRDELITHLLTMKNGTDKTTPQPEYASAAAEFYRSLLPEWNIGRGLSEAIEKQKQDQKNG